MWNIVILTLVLLLLCAQEYNMCTASKIYITADRGSIQQSSADQYRLESSSLFHETITKGLHSIVYRKEPELRTLVEHKEVRRRFGSLNKNEILHFLPKFHGALLPNGKPLSWDAHCFRNNTATFTLNKDRSGGTVVFDVQNPHTALCADWYFVATRYSFFLKLFFVHGRHSVTIKNLHADELADIEQNGIRIFSFQDGVVGTLIDMWHVFKILDGYYFMNDHIRFLREYMNITFVERPHPIVELDERYIQSGDYFGVTSLDGLDIVLMYGTGGTLGHTTVALWIDGELFICESNERGIIRTPYKDWIKKAIKDQRMAMIAPLRPELRARFNETKAVEFFKSVEGLPYGFHNLLYAWIDTVNDNFPPPVSDELVPFGLAIFDKIAPKVILRMVVEGLNQRLHHYYNMSVTCADMDCVFNLLINKLNNESLGSLMTLPERDSWVYSDGRSMVCDVFVLNLYKAAGVFGEQSDWFESAEFTPKDLYQLQIFDADYKHSRPEPCNANKDQYPYCQILGQYYWELPGFNSIPLYPHMNEKCGCLPPDFIRTPEKC